LPLAKAATGLGNQQLPRCSRHAIRAWLFPYTFGGKASGLKSLGEMGPDNPERRKARSAEFTVDRALDRYEVLLFGDADAGPSSTSR
jgi:hypothetical protein